MDALSWLLIGTLTALWRVLGHLAAFVSGVAATLFWQYDREATPEEK